MDSKKITEIPNCFYRVSVKALVLNETRDKFLICREAVGYWNLPGGGLEWGASPQEDLPREIAEEMGLAVEKVADNPCYFVTDQQTINPSIKIANVIYETILDNLDFRASDECLEIKFVDRHDLKDLQVFPDVIKLAEMFKPENHEREPCI